MSDLLDFTLEEWADKPYLIELRGGFYDGKRHHWHNLPLTWRQAEPAPPFSITAVETEPATAMSGIPIADYRMTEHVTDDGARIYEYYGHE